MGEREGGTGLGKACEPGLELGTPEAQPHHVSVLPTRLSVLTSFCFLMWFAM